jgi:putative transposase
VHAGEIELAFADAMHPLGAGDGNGRVAEPFELEHHVHPRFDVPMSEKTAALTLREFEQWLAIEVARRYHHAAHRGLLGATPADTWRMLARNPDLRQLPATADAELRFLIRFLPAASRTIQAYGLTLFHIRYWHPILVAWRETRRAVTVRYHPEDLSRIFVTAGTRDYLEVRYADMRHPAISLF